MKRINVEKFHQITLPKSPFIHTLYALLSLNKYILKTFHCFPNELIYLICTILYNLLKRVYFSIKTSTFSFCRSSIIQVSSPRVHSKISPRTQNSVTSFDRSLEGFYIFGSGSNGELGININQDEQKLPFVKFECVEDIVFVGCGTMHTLVLNQKGELYGSGGNAYGQLGLGDSDERNIFEKINMENIVTIGCGAWHTIILNHNNELFGCGFNSYGQLGLGDTNQKHKLFEKININFTSNCSTTVNDNNIISIECGSFHTIILNSKGEIYGSGQNQYGQLGFDGSCSCFVSFKKLNIDNIVIIGCGSFHTLVLNLQGELFVTGQNENGELGYGNKYKQLYSFQKVFITLYIGKIIKISCGLSHTMILNDKGEIFAAGDNSFGQLGLDHRTSGNGNFKKVNLKDIISIGCGSRHTIALDREGKIYGTGLNDSGQLGFVSSNSTTSEKSFKRININYMVNL